MAARDDLGANDTMTFVLNNVGFVFASLFGLIFLGRKIGWALSRGYLYSAPWLGLVVGCVAWGALTAISVETLLHWLQPNVFVKWIFGYGAGVYAAIPNYGLVDEQTVPEHALPKHTAIKAVSLLVYIGLLVLAAFFDGSSIS